MHQPYELSVILAEARDNPDAAPALAAIERSCAGHRVEVLLVRPAGRVPPPDTYSLPVRELLTGASTLVPDRWGHGVRLSSAPVFACLTTELLVHPQWASALLEALSDGSVGASGSIALAPASTAVAGALYLVRFSAFLPKSRGTFDVAHNIPGDSAMYRRDAVASLPELLEQGFWEADFHRQFHARGDRLRYTERELCSFQSAITLAAAVEVRARHGHGFGMTRVRQLGQPAMRVIAAAPLVPLVLLSRIAQRARSSSGAAVLLLRTVLPLFAILAAWAWGECAGAWHARSASSRGVTR